MPDVEIVPAQKLVKKNDDILAVTEMRPNGLTWYYNFLSDKRQMGEIVQNFRNLDPVEKAEAEVLRERFKKMGGKPRLPPGQGTWH